MDTKSVISHANSLAAEKLDYLVKTTQEMQSTMSVFLPAIQKNLNLLISDAMIQPGKFVILPIQNSFNITDKFFKKYKIRFICEVDDAYHLVDGKEFGYEMKEFTAVSQGLMIGAQFLLSAAVTALAPAAGNIINGVISGFLPKIGSKASSALLEKLEGASQELSKGINSWKLNSSECSKLEKESCDALKEFVKKFLEGKDTSKLGVAKANRSDGTVCWLCVEHYKDEVIEPIPGRGKTNSIRSAWTNADETSSVANPANVEPELPAKSLKVINQSVIDFWDSRDPLLDWKYFFTEVVLEMKIDQNTHYLNEKLLREKFGDYSNALPSLSLTLFKRAVGNEDIKDFFQKFIVDRKVEAEELKKKKSKLSRK